MENDILQQILTEIVRTNKRLEGIETEITGLKEEATSLTEEMTGMKQELSEIKDRLTVIEQKHGQKLSALFDGYSLLYDMVGEIRLDVQQIKNKQEKHDFQINFLRGRESFTPEKIG